MVQRGTAKVYIFILIILTFLTLLGAIPSMTLHGIWDYIGINDTSKISISSTCSSYVTTKFGNGNSNRQIFAAFLAVCMAFLLTAAIFGVLMMFLCSVFLSPEQNDKQHMPIITSNKIQILYFLASFDLLCITVNLGHFLTFYWEIPTICNSADLSLQQIVMFSLSGFMFLMMFLVWLGILILNQSVKQYLTDNETIDTPLIAKDRQHHKDKQIQMKKYMDQEREQLSSARKSLINKDQYESNRRETMNDYIDPGKLYIASELKERRKGDINNRHLYQIDERKDQTNRSNLRSNIYYGKDREFQERNPREKQTLVYHKERVPEQREIRGNSYEKQQKNQNYSKNTYNRHQSQKKLEQSHYRQDNSRSRHYEYDQPRRISPPRYEDDRRSPSRSYKTPERQRKGMLIDYIRGRYVE